MTFLKIVTVSHKQGKLCGVFKLTSVCRDQGGTVRAERERASWVTEGSQALW